MNPTHKLILSTILIAGMLAAARLRSAERPIEWGNSIGIFGGGAFNMHTPEIAPQLFGATAPVSFTEPATSFSGFFGAEGNFQVHRLIVLSARAGLDWAGADFTAKSGINTTNKISTSLQYLELSPMIKLVNVIPGLENMYFTTGFTFGLPLSTTYSATQQTGRLPRSTAGDIPSPNMNLTLPIGIGYILQYKRINIIPEISYNFNFAEVSNNSQWKPWNFAQAKAGVSITYSLPKSAPKPPPDTIIPTNISLEMSEIYSIDKNGQKKPVQNIRIEEAEYGEYFPLIPYIFYDVNATTLSDNYKQNIDVSDRDENLPQADHPKFAQKAQTQEPAQTGSPTEETPLPSDGPTVSQQVLTIIAKRMQENPIYRLTITGTIDGKYETDTSVATARAEEVKHYMVQNFGINPERLATISAGLPAKPSAQSVRDGIVENRRVELGSNNPELFEPVFVRGEKKSLAFPDNVNFVPKIRSNKPLTGWQLQIMQADRPIKHFSGDTLLADSTLAIEWKIMMNDLYPSEIPLEYKLDISTADTTVSYIGYINIDHNSITIKKTIEQPDYIINKYSLVLFDFDSPLLTDANKKVVDKFIIPDIGLGSTVDIYGYTDRIGHPDYNLQLSMARANAVKDYITSRRGNAQINAYGLGNTTELFDNELAVGRQLSRTVQVFVVTPR